MALSGDNMQATGRDNLIVTHLPIVSDLGDAFVAFSTLGLEEF